MDEGEWKGPTAAPKWLRDLENRLREGWAADVLACGWGGPPRRASCGRDRDNATTRTGEEGTILKWTLRASAATRPLSVSEQEIPTRKAVFIASAYSARDTLSTAYQYQNLPLGLTSTTDVSIPWAALDSPGGYSLLPGLAYSYGEHLLMALQCFAQRRRFRRLFLLSWHFLGACVGISGFMRPSVIGMRVAGHGLYRDIRFRRLLAYNPYYIECHHVGAGGMAAESVGEPAGRAITTAATIYAAFLSPYWIFALSVGWEA